MPELDSRPLLHFCYSFVVRNVFWVVVLAFAIFLFAPFSPAGVPGQSTEQQQAPPAEPPGQQAPAVPNPPPPPPVPPGPVIVLNPAHGGTDSGARGQNGATEKDLVLRMARGVKVELERQGFRVILTRNDDSNPSYDERAAMANGYRDAIFISLHMASTGPADTVRAYYDQLSEPYVFSGDTGSIPEKSARAGGLTSWDEAQRPYMSASHRLADLIQIELAQKFPESPDTSASAALRGLRSVAAPAVAIELSSVSVPDPSALANAAWPPLADAIGRALTAFRAASVGDPKP